VAGLVAIAAVGAVVAASFGSRLEDEVGDQANRPEVAAAVEVAKNQPLAAVEVQGVPEEVQASVRDAAEDASVGAFRVGVGIATALVALGGVLGLVGIQNPRRRVSAADCPGGQLAGHPREGAKQSPCDWHQHARPREAPAPPLASRWGDE
jgi:hypothetical protein